MQTVSDPNDNANMYVTALETRVNYRDSFFTRYGQFLTLQGLLVGALTLTSNQFFAEDTIFIVIGVAGSLLSLLWFWATVVSMRSLKAWGKVLEKLEADFEAIDSSTHPIFSMYQDEKVNITKITEIVRDLFGWVLRFKRLREGLRLGQVPRFEYILPIVVFCLWVMIGLWGIRGVIA